MKKFNSFKISSFFNKTSITGMLLASLAAGMTFSSSSHAETGFTNYVTDSVEIPMRRAPGYSYKILYMLKSGTPVQILEVNADGWANIQVKRKGELVTGWMPSNVLQNQPISEVRLETQQRKMNAIEEKYNAVQEELKTLKQRFNETDKSLSTIKQEKFELTQQLNHIKSISKNTIQLDEENQAIKLKLNSLEDQNAIMREQIDQSEDAIKRQWFLTGAGVLLLGLLIGRFFKTPGKRKKWGDF